MKFCQKRGDAQTEIIRKVQKAFGDDVTSITRTKEWCDRFGIGYVSASSDILSGWPSTSRNDDVIDKVQRVCKGYRCSGVGSVHSIAAKNLAVR